MSLPCIWASQVGYSMNYLRFFPFFNVMICSSPVENKNSEEYLRPMRIESLELVKVSCVLF